MCSFGGGVVNHLCPPYLLLIFQKNCCCLTVNSYTEGNRQRLETPNPMDLWIDAAPNLSHQQYTQQRPEPLHLVHTEHGTTAAVSRPVNVLQQNPHARQQHRPAAALLCHFPRQNTRNPIRSPFLFPVASALFYG